MNKLTSDQVAAIIEDIKANQAIRNMKSHPWVTEDGAYDHEEYSLRVFIWNGFCYLTANRGWVEDPVANQRLPEWMRKPWNFYTPLPPKPPKKDK